MKFDKKFFDFESFNEALLADFFSRNERLKHFLIEKNLMHIFRNFLNKYRSRVHQKGLNDQFDFLEDKTPKKQNNNAENDYQDRKNKIQRENLNKSVEKEELVRKALKKIKAQKNMVFLEKIKKKREVIRQIPEKFNLWEHQKKKDKRSISLQS